MNWISVKDRLPQLREIVMINYDGIIDIGQIEAIYHREEDTPVIMWNFRDICCNELYHIEKVTHWMTLPKGPNERGSDNT